MCEPNNGKSCRPPRGAGWGGGLKMAKMAKMAGMGGWGEVFQSFKVKTAFEGSKDFSGGLPRVLQPAAVPWSG